MVEPQIVVLVVAGSSPVDHPIFQPEMVSVAQLDRAADFGSAGWGFESLQARINPCRLCFLETRRYSRIVWIKFCFVRCVVDRQLSFPQW